MRSHLPHHNFYNPGSEGHKGDHNFYIPETEHKKEPSIEAPRPEPSRNKKKGESWEDLKRTDYLAHLSMAVEEKMVPVLADPEFHMIEPPSDDDVAPEDTSKTTEFVWKGGKPSYLDELKEAPKLKVKVPVRRTDLDGIKAFHRSESGTITEIPVLKPDNVSVEPSPEADSHHPTHTYKVIDIAEDLRKLAGAQDRRQINGKELLAADALKEGERRNDDKRFEQLYHDILGKEFIGPSGQRVNRNEVIHLIEQVRDYVRKGNLAQAEIFLGKIPADHGLCESVRKLTRIQDLRMKHARESLDRAYGSGDDKDTP